MGKKIGKNISKNLSGKYSQKLLDHTKKSATDAYKTLQKFTKSQQIYNKIFQRQLQMSMIKKYPKKDMYLQNKCKKLLTN